METGKILTISIAAYNVENFIKKTLDSVIINEYFDSLEVFIVNDGSTDKTDILATAYRNRYPNIFHVINQSNSGYGSTVNYSIMNASGKYFKLLDGDDWFDNNNFVAIVKFLKDVDFEIIVTDYYIERKNNNLELISCRQKDFSIFNIEKYSTRFPHGHWSIFYKTDILKKSKLKLPDKLFYTDQIYSTIPWLYAKTVCFRTLPVYCYRCGYEEQSTSNISRINHINDMLKICEILYDFYENKKQFCGGYLLRRVSRYYTVALKTILLCPASEENYCKLLEYEKATHDKHIEIYRDALKNNKIGKIILLLRLSRYRLYWILKSFLFNK